MLSKYTTLEKENLIFVLQAILNNKNYNKIYLEQYFETYNNSVENYSKLCMKCLEWENLDLPYDCLCKPDYCLKNEQDFKIINLYEDLKMQIEIIESCQG